ncbi:MAG: regulatory protein RecX [Pseudomonadota bacterium]
MDNVEITAAAIRFSAMNLLAMREHSVAELTQKLQKKFGNFALSDNREFFNCHECIAATIAKLTSEGLQSDSRFTEAFIVMRQRQGKGPLLVRMELQERGIHNEVVAAFMDATDQIWNQIAEKVFIKKFGGQVSQDIKQMSKQMRFLTSRGFSPTNIQSVLKRIDPRGE